MSSKKRYQESSIGSPRTSRTPAKALRNLCQVVESVEHLRVVFRDADDDRVLECAMAGAADFIVTGDRHLLDLGSYQTVRIVTVRQLMDILLPAS